MDPRGVMNIERGTHFTHDNTPIIRRFIEEYQRPGNVAIPEELLASDLTAHTARPGNATRM